MSNGLEILKNIGAQKVHEQTHIAKHFVEMILNEDFEKMSKTHFVGFISILEREYEIDLSDLKADGLECFENKVLEIKEPSRVYAEPSNNKKYSIVSIGLAVIVLAFIASYTLSNMSFDSNDKVHVVNNDVIKSVQKNIKQTAQDKNESTPIKKSTPELKKAEVKKDTPKPEVEKASVKSFTLLPKAKLWLGYIDMDTHKKYQKIVKESISLDPEKRWLLLLGHGSLDVEIDGKVTQYRLKTVRFKYEDGNLTKITEEEFKDLNKGRKW